MGLKVTQDVTGRNICNHVPKNVIIVTIKPGALDISQPLFTRPKKIRCYIHRQSLTIAREKYGWKTNFFLEW